MAVSRGNLDGVDFPDVHQLSSFSNWVSASSLRRSHSANSVCSSSAACRLCDRRLSFKRPGGCDSQFQPVMRWLAVGRQGVDPVSRVPPADDRILRRTGLPVEQGYCTGSNKPLEEFRTAHRIDSQQGCQLGNWSIAYAGSTTRPRELAASCLRGLRYERTREEERGTS
jgi:hypothetical protein